MVDVKRYPCDNPSSYPQDELAVWYPSNTCVNVCVCQELPCPLVSWLVGELRGTCPEVHKGNRQGNVVSAILGGELRALLEELHCPYTALATETLTPELLNTATEFLVGELQAARILQYRKHHPEDTLRQDNTEREKREGEDRGVDLEGEGRGGDGAVWDKEGEADIREEIVQLFQVLSLDPSSQLSDAYTEVESRITLLPGGTVAEPLLKTTLNSEQWRKLEQITLALAKDYECRRDMMTKRFQVTLQSFEWGEKGPERSAALSSVQPLSALFFGSRVSLSLLLAAREDQSRVLPVRAGQSTAIHKVLMGSVPDRGGRPGEIEPPMPVWERRREGGGRGGRRIGHPGHSGRKKKNKKKE